MGANSEQAPVGEAATNAADYAMLIDRYWQRHLPRRRALVHEPLARARREGDRMHRYVTARARVLVLAYADEHPERVAAAGWDCIWASAVFSAESDAFQQLFAHRRDLPRPAALLLRTLQRLRRHRTPCR